MYADRGGGNSTPRALHAGLEVVAAIHRFYGQPNRPTIRETFN
jgi:hypothetical protein